ncbi:hypothetical protein CXB51_026674 [Gossypium anomalum]|uniref:Reverse transcriptase Ty1/copia-type domain-containing protein n=1 Tax=Gossypium anomalum TaxID=47600 RepID=A0A8J5YSU1_9ROSI|nr:hypothetical protein CXB51_026674 [Gossypium anomalum]
MARCLLFESKLPSKFWAKAVNTSVYLLNRLPTNAVKEKTPFEAWFRLKPTVSHLKVFGCVCYTLIPAEKRTKLERRSVPGIFIGYSSTKKGYRVFDPSTKKTMVSRDVKFDEGRVWNWNDKDASLSEENQQDSNLPGQKRVIGVKWVFRVKYNADGSLNKHNPRLVVKGYGQQYGINFIETFAPVARLDTIKLLFALAAQKDGFKVPDEEDKVYKIKKGLVWSEVGTKGLKSENETLLIVSLYVDNLLVAGSKGELIEEFKMQITSVAQGEKLTSNGNHERVDEKEYRSLVGCLLYLTATRPDIMFVVSLLSRFIHCYDVVHFKAAKRVLRYVKGTLNYGVKFEKGKELKLTGYSDSDWAGFIDNMKSISGNFFTLGSGVFCWCSKKQQTVAQSIAEAEYIAAAAAINQAIWLRKLLCDLNEDHAEATKIRVDNQLAVAIAKNLVFHGKTKHFKIKYHFVREAEQSKEVRLVHYSSENQFADILTKSLGATRFNTLRRNIGVCCIQSKKEC